MIYNNILETIGKTPLVKVKKIQNDMADIYVKIESFNPGSSIKDRAAFYMILDAEKKGIISKGDTIIEATSGNTGIALAMIGASKGYKIKIIMPETMSEERKLLIKAYGAELILTTGSLGMKGSVDHANKLVEEFGYFMPSQFKNQSNVKAHYEVTSMEILEDMENGFDAFVVGVGTGGTVSGIGKRIKEEIEEVLVVAVQPEKSQVLTNGSPSGHGIQGIGANFIPEIYNPDVVDRVLNMTEEEAFDASRYLAKREGILSGISSGANFAAAIKIAKELGSGKKVVTVLPDTGERYLSTILFKGEKND